MEIRKGRAGEKVQKAGGECNTQSSSPDQPCAQGRLHLPPPLTHRGRGAPRAKLRGKSKQRSPRAGLSGTVRSSAGRARGEPAPTPAAHHNTPLTTKSRSSVDPTASSPGDRPPGPAPAVPMFTSLHDCVRRQLGPGESGSEAEEKGSALHCPCTT